jgi:uncharacterized protein (DUF1501 family)
MDAVTRRRFLIGSGVSAGLALAGGAGVIGWETLAHRAAGNPQPSGTRVLVLVTLYGGNDGLNTVVPAGDKTYQDSRADLAYRPADVLDLGDGLGLNPGMKGMKALWDAGQLAVVRGVSYPKPDRSHFTSMAIWQTASPATPIHSGWLGRWLDESGDPLLAVSLDPVLPPALVGDRTAGVTLPLSGLALPTGPLGEAFRLLGNPSPGEPDLRARAAGSVADLVHAAAVLKGADRSAAGSGTPTGGGTAGGRGQLADQLALVARCLEIGAPARVYSVSLGGFDTHADERDTQQRLLSELDSAVAGFLARVARTPRADDVVMAVYSEFGRRVKANASAGTDHGTAGPVFVAGRKVIGGFHGDQPSLTDLDDGDLKSTMDFRDVYAGLLSGVLGADPGRVLGGWRSAATLVTT